MCYICVKLNDTSTVYFWNQLQFSLHSKGNFVIQFHSVQSFNPLMPSGAFNICCPRDCVCRHNGGTLGAPLKPLRDDGALTPLCRETQSLGQQMLNAPVDTVMGEPRVSPLNPSESIVLSEHYRL